VALQSSQVVKPTSPSLILSLAPQHVSGMCAGKTQVGALNGLACENILVLTPPPFMQPGLGCPVGGMDKSWGEEPSPLVNGRWPLQCQKLELLDLNP
jgi:hypothetical protein